MNCVRHRVPGPQQAAPGHLTQFTATVGVFLLVLHGKSVLGH